MSVSHSSENDINIKDNFDDESDTFEKLLDRIQNALFSSIFVMAKEAKVTMVGIVLEMVVDFFQMLSFALFDGIDFGWHSPSIGWLQTLANGFRYFESFHLIEL